MESLEVVESYVLLGIKRYVVRVKGSRIKVNVAASSESEALKRVKELLSAKDGVEELVKVFNL